MAQRPKDHLRFIYPDKFEPTFEVVEFSPASAFSRDSFDCAVVVAFNSKEARFLADQIDWYSALPVFVFVGEKPVTRTDHVHMTAEEAQSGKLMGTIIQMYNDIDSRLRNSFIELDAQNKGKISLGSLP